jgi:hypothetical protein
MGVEWHKEAEGEGTTRVTRNEYLAEMVELLGEKIWQENSTQSVHPINQIPNKVERERETEKELENYDKLD